MINLSNKQSYKKLPNENPSTQKIAFQTQTFFHIDFGSKISISLYKFYSRFADQFLHIFDRISINRSDIFFIRNHCVEDLWDFEWYLVGYLNNFINKRRSMKLKISWSISWKILAFFREFVAILNFSCIWNMF